MKESKGRTEKAAEGSLEPVLDAIESRVEALVERNAVRERVERVLKTLEAGADAGKA